MNLIKNNEVYYVTFFEILIHIRSLLDFYYLVYLCILYYGLREFNILILEVVAIVVNLVIHREKRIFKRNQSYCCQIFKKHVYSNKNKCSILLTTYDYFI